MTAKQKLQIGVDKINESPWVTRVLMISLSIIGVFCMRLMQQQDETQQKINQQLETITTQLNQIIIAHAIQGNNVTGNEKRITALESRMAQSEVESRKSHESIRDWVEDWVYKNFQRKI